MNNIKLSIIILNYNTKELVKNCLQSLKKVRDEAEFEVIVVDNGSTDGSAEFIKESFPWVSLIETGSNFGFAKGNNQARATVSGEYILFLNSDTEVHTATLKGALGYMEANPNVGVVTCKMVLPSGGVDKDSRRSFPTPWVAFTHFSGLDTLMPKSKNFAKYWYGYKGVGETFDIDVAQGAFFFTRKIVLDKVDWFDESYFLDGEDIDLSWRIKAAGYRIVYYPEISILHIKGATKGKRIGHNQSLSKEERKRNVTSGVDSMEIFYKKRLWKNYPWVLNILVVFGINLLKLIRLLKL